MESAAEGLTLTQQGLNALRTGDLAQAIALLGQAAHANPQDFDAAYGVGVALAQNQQLKEAADWLNYAASLRTDSVPALFSLGQTYFALNDFAQAKATLQKVFALQPDHERARDLLTEIHQSELRAAELDQAMRLTEIASSPPAPISDKSGQPLKAEGASPVVQGERCPQCGAMNPVGYRVCNLCSLPSPKLKEHKEVATAREEMFQKERKDAASEEQGKKILAIMATVCAVLMSAQLARILYMMKSSSLITQMVLYNLVVQAAVPFFVSLVVLSMFEAVQPGQSVVKASATVAIAIVIALQVDSLLIEPIFGLLISFIPFGGLIILGSCIYIATMIALEKAAGTRLDLSHTLSAAITIPTLVMLIIASIVVGVAVIFGGVKDDKDRIATGKSASEKQMEKSMERLQKDLDKMMMKGKNPPAR